MEEISEMYPEVVAQYTHEQVNETTRFIDPDDSQITMIAETVYGKLRQTTHVSLAKASSCG